MTTQTFAGLTWEGCLPAAGQGMLDAVERRFGVKLPATVRDLLDRCHGGAPVERGTFRYRHPRIGMVKSGLGALLPIDPTNPENVERTLDGLAIDKQLPSGLIPFATDGGGDYICLDYRQNRTAPRVVYWMHEREGADSVARLAESVDDFLAGLEPDATVPADLR